MELWYEWLLCASCTHDSLAVMVLLGNQVLLSISSSVASDKPQPHASMMAETFLRSVEVYKVVEAKLQELFEGWRGDSVVQNTGCSSRDSGSTCDSQHPLRSSHCQSQWIQYPLLSFKGSAYKGTHAGKMPIH